MSFENLIIRLIRETMEDPDLEITLETRLEEDLGLDSFSSMMILNGIEDEFQVTIDESEVNGISTVKDIVDRFATLYDNWKEQN